MDEKKARNILEKYIQNEIGETLEIVRLVEMQGGTYYFLCNDPNFNENDPTLLPGATATPTFAVRDNGEVLCLPT